MRIHKIFDQLILCLQLCIKLAFGTIFMYWSIAAISKYISGPITSTVMMDMHWRRTKVETTGATQDYETLFSRIFETFLDFKTKKQVVPWHQWHHLVRRHCNGFGRF